MSCMYQVTSHTFIIDKIILFNTYMYVLRDLFDQNIRHMYKWFECSGNVS